MSILCYSPKNLDAVALGELKQKIIRDYNNYLQSLRQGYKNDYSYILHEISLVDTYLELDNQKTLYEYFMNYELQ